MEVHDVDNFPFERIDDDIMEHDGNCFISFSLSRIIEKIHSSGAPNVNDCAIKCTQIRETTQTTREFPHNCPRLTEFSPFRKPVETER